MTVQHHVGQFMGQVKPRSGHVLFVEAQKDVWQTAHAAGKCVLSAVLQIGLESAAYFHNEQDRAVLEAVKVTKRGKTAGKEDGKGARPLSPTRPRNKSRSTHAGGAG
jgi:hypothetical protein